MKTFATLANTLVLGISLVATCAQAAPVVPLTLSDPIQLGRLSRNGINQNFAGDEPFPGVINTGTKYHFHAYSLNVGSTPYIDIISDSTFATLFISAYQTSYHPNNLALGWLGDEGTSGDYFGTDTLFFDVTAAANSTLVLVMNESTTNGGVGLAAPTFLITGYSCNDFSCAGIDLTNSLSPFATVIPEPSTIALVGLPFAALVVRRRRRAATA